MLYLRVGRIHRYLKQRTQNNMRIGAKSRRLCRGHSRILLRRDVGTSDGPVRFASRFFGWLIHAFSRKVVRQKIRVLSTPRYQQSAIRGDKELETLVDATIAGGGVMPFIHKTLTFGNIKKPERRRRNLCAIGDFVPLSLAYFSIRLEDTVIYTFFVFACLYPQLIPCVTSFNGTSKPGRRL